MAGPFDRFLSPYDKMTPSPNVVSRENDFQWDELDRPLPPPIGTPTNDAILEALDSIMRERNPHIPAITNRLQMDAGTGDVSAITDDELMKFILNIDAMNPDPTSTARRR